MSENLPAPRDLLSKIPEDLVDWFTTGSAAADRYGLPRIDIRWRAVEVMHVWETDDGEPRIWARRIREFKTKERCETAVKRWQAEARGGTTFLVQPAVVFWLTDDEMERIPFT